MMTVLMTMKMSDDDDADGDSNAHKTSNADDECDAVLRTCS